MQSVRLSTDGGVTAAVLASGQWVRSTAVSADGSRLAASLDGRLWVAMAPRWVLEEVRLPAEPPELLPGDMAWIGNDRLIVAVEERVDGVPLEFAALSNLWLVEPALGEVRRVTDFPADAASYSLASTPVSVGGNSVAFVVLTGSDDASRAQLSNELFVLDVESGDVHRVRELPSTPISRRSSMDRRR